MIGIIDYNAGNIRSVEMALESLKIPYLISKNPKDLQNATRLIFPGVGDANYAMEQLKQSGFDSFIKEKVAANTPLLGICLGSQIIFDFSEEGDTPCLGLLPGKIRHFEKLFAEQNIEKNGYKIPHMGWNDLQRKDSPLFTGVSADSSFYFVHSYVICPQNAENVLATADYGVKVPAVIHSKNIWACQFHPEKSGKAGLQLLQNFCTLKEGDLC